MEDVVGDTEEVRGISKMLITRIKVMNNDMIKIDMSVSAALGLTPDLDKIARAENFVESGSIDARRDETIGCHIHNRKKDGESLCKT